MRDPSPLLLLAKHDSPQASDAAPLPPLLLTDVTEDYNDPSHVSFGVLMGAALFSRNTSPLSFVGNVG